MTMGHRFWKSDIRRLTDIVRSIVYAETPKVQLEAGKALFDYTVDGHVHDDLKELAEQVALLMIQKEGRDLHLEFMADDLEKTSQALEKAQLDPLTSLPNRGRFYHALDGMTQGAVLLLDLDHFKPVNDEYGHDAGDALLAQVARRISMVVGKSGFAARLGGDEFVMIVTGDSAMSHASALARTLLTVLKQPFYLDAGRVEIDASIGIGEKTKDLEPRMALKHADLAMYDAKRAGRGRFGIYSSATIPA